MKKTIIVTAILLSTSIAFAMGDRSKNIGVGGSNDNQHKHRTEYTMPVSPDRPVSPVPEPTTLLLLSAGLIGLAIVMRGKK
jgi:hypothetical protein